MSNSRRLVLPPVVSGADNFRWQTMLEDLHTHKLEAVGRLAAGVAHEVNTFIQVIGDSLHFVRDADTVDASTTEVVDRALDSLDRIRILVRSMKEFAHTDAAEMAPADLNHAIRSTLALARNDYKYVADVALDLAEIPSVTCFRSNVSHAILSLVVHAVRAIEDHVKGTGHKGLITVRSRDDGDDVVVTITDTVDAPRPTPTHSDRSVAIARFVIVDMHGGELTFDTSEAGTTCRMRLPIDGPASSGAAA